MPRGPRVVSPGVPHHITQRTVRGLPMFESDQDKKIYLSLLTKAVARSGFSIWAYCLMSNHVHVIGVPTFEASMAVAIRDAHGAYARYFNTEHGYSGHLMQNRFYSCVLKERHLLAAIRYVELNPVRAGMIKAAWEYDWSSAKVHCLNAKSSFLSQDFNPLDLVGDWKEFLTEEEDEDFLKQLRQMSRRGKW